MLSTTTPVGLWVTVSAMRWDRLFAGLEDEADRLARDEVEALAADLSDETWAATSWRDLVGGRVRLEVRGAGQVAGEVASVNDSVVRLRGDDGDRLVATRAVVEVVEAERRASTVSRVDALLGWRSALRRLRDADEPVRVVLDDGRVVDGRVDAVGADFVRIETVSGRRRVLVLDAVAVVSPRA